MSAGKINLSEIEEFLNNSTKEQLLAELLMADPEGILASVHDDVLSYQWLAPISLPFEISPQSPGFRHLSHTGIFSLSLLECASFEELALAA